MFDKAIGIDLGTTNSVVGVLDLGDGRLMLGRHGSADRPEPVLPSAVAWLPGENRMVVGRAARARRGLDPEPILSVKRRMGKPLPVELAGQQMSPAQVSALILKQIVADLRPVLTAANQDIEVRRAVITVPAHFQHAQLEDTTRAGEEAGLEVVELLHEPIAAVIHYCWTRQRDRLARGETAPDREETFLVYDLGGGTFDVTVIRKIPNPRTGADFQTLAIAGDSFLGGDDFDEALARHLLQRLTKMPDVDIASDNPGEASNRLRFAKLRALAEEIKIALSDRDQYEVDRQDFVKDDRGKPVNLKFPFTRPEFEAVIRGTAERTIPFSQQALDEAKLAASQVDTVLLIGGSSRVPLVKQLVETAFCPPAAAKKPELVRHSPDLCVGAGAALKAASLGRLVRGPSVSVLLKGYGGSARPAATVPVDLVGGDVAGLKGGQATLTAAGKPPLAGKVLGPQRALFDYVPLAEMQNNHFDLRLRNAGGTDVAAVNFFIRHDPLFVEPLGVNTSATVLSYRLTLEVRDPARDELVHTELAPKLTALPNEFEYRFQFPGETDLLRFPLFGDGHLIKNILIPVERGLPTGAEIRLRVAIDPSQKVHCRGEIPDAVGGHEFKFEVEAPEPEKVPTRDDYLALAARAEALLKQYRGPDRAKRAMQIAKIRAEIDRAFEHRDDAKVIQRLRELKTLLDELDPARFRLEPPPEKLDDLYVKCMAILDQLPPESTLRKDEIREDVEQNRDAGHAAAKQFPPDQATYSKCFGNLERNCEVLMREYQRLVKPPTSPREEAVNLIKQANKRHAELAARPLPGADVAVLKLAKEAISRAQDVLPVDAKQAAEEARQALRLMYPLDRQKEDTPKPGGEGTHVWGAG